MKFKSALKRVLFGPSGERPREIYAGLLKGQQFYVDTSCKAMRLIGLDEQEIAECMRTASEGAHTAVDVGAADGWYTLHFASRPTLEKVWAFEPDPFLQERIRNNLRLNALLAESRTVIDARMVGNSDNEHCCRLDTVFSDVKYPLVLKVDVDGAEMEVLSGAQAVLSNGKCSLIVETHSLDLEKECIRFLENLGYRCRVIPNAWYRAFMPESRILPHNRWLVACSEPSLSMGQKK
jgi:predicted RNA methylase